jgi:hypothetical protein
VGNHFGVDRALPCADLFGYVQDHSPNSPDGCTSAEVHKGMRHKADFGVTVHDKRQEDLTFSLGVLSFGFIQSRVIFRTWSEQKVGFEIHTDYAAIYGRYQTIVKPLAYGLQLGSYVTIRHPIFFGEPSKNNLTLVHGPR